MHDLKKMRLYERRKEKFQMEEKRKRWSKTASEVNLHKLLYNWGQQQKIRFVPAKYKELQ